MLFDSRQQSCWRDWKLTMIIFFFFLLFFLCFFSQVLLSAATFVSARSKKIAHRLLARCVPLVYSSSFCITRAHTDSHTHTPALVVQFFLLSNLSPISLQSLSNLSEYACSTYKERKVWMRRRRRKEQYYVLSHKSHHIRYTSIISGHLLFQQQSIQLDIVFSPQLPHFIITGMWTSTKDLDWWDQKEEQNFFFLLLTSPWIPITHSQTTTFFFSSFSPPSLDLPSLLVLFWSNQTPPLIEFDWISKINIFFFFSESDRSLLLDQNICCFYYFDNTTNEWTISIVSKSINHHQTNWTASSSNDSMPTRGRHDSTCDASTIESYSSLYARTSHTHPSKLRTILFIKMWTQRKKSIR